MKGQFISKGIRKSGNYISALDYDASFADRNNPHGYFKMVIQPIENSRGQHEIRYMKTLDGIRVSGEAYILTGETEMEIDEKYKRRFSSDHWEKLIQTEVKTENDLW